MMVVEWQPCLRQSTMAGASAGSGLVSSGLVGSGLVSSGLVSSGIGALLPRGWGFDELSEQAKSTKCNYI